MMPPLNRAIAEFAEETGTNPMILYAWRKQAGSRAALMPGDEKQSESWFSSGKFRVLVESVRTLQRW